MKLLKVQVTLLKDPVVELSQEIWILGIRATGKAE
jgi:hypothetical protein